MTYETTAGDTPARRATSRCVTRLSRPLVSDGRIRLAHPHLHLAWPSIVPDRVRHRHEMVWAHDRCAGAVELVIPVGGFGGQRRSADGHDVVVGCRLE